MYQLSRRAFNQDVLGSLLTFSLLETLFSRDALADEVKPLAAAWLAKLDAMGRDDVIARRWQGEFEGLPRPITPTLVLPDGYISRGLGALARLGALAEEIP